MRRQHLTQLIGTFVVAAALIGLPTVAFAQIASSLHNFGGSSWNPGDEICAVCHTPHNALAVTDAPLWDHASTAAAFTPYSSGTLDATVGQPAGVSKLCLSCHDGTVSLDSFAGVTGGTDFITGAALFGTDLSNDHPISFTYDDALAITDPGLKPPTTTASGIVANIDDDMLFGAGNDQLECASCHDPHNAGISKLLIKSNSASALCLTCHDK